MGHFTVLGCGAWATTIAKVLGENGAPVQLWCHRAEYRDLILSTGENQLSLPGVTLPPTVMPTLNFDAAFIDCEGVILGVPSVHLPPLLARLFLKPALPVLSIVKGVLDQDEWEISRVFHHHYRGPFSVLSGPNLAREVALQNPAASVVASEDQNVARFFQSALSRPYFRLYTSHDVIGVELGGILKNIWAIAAGICDGLALGHNAKASLLTRGLREMIHLGVDLGGTASTFYGLSGLGDLMATCHSTDSRNWKVGYQIGQGRGMFETSASAVPEGVRTALHFSNIAQMRSLTLPITSLIGTILQGGITPQDAFIQLMDRELTSE